MPLPKPNNGETESEFIARCMTFLDKEKNLKDEKTRKQALAICYSQYKRNVKAEGRKQIFSNFLLELNKDF